MNLIKLQRRLTQACAIPPQPNRVSRIPRFAPSFSGDSLDCSKEFYAMLHFMARSGLLALSLLLLATMGAAQPPPLGPPLNRTEEGRLGVPSITDFVRAETQKQLDLTNAILKADGKPYRVSIESVSTIGGHRSQTVSVNKPNSWCVLLPYAVKIKVDIPHGLDRHIFVPVDVKFFCDGWHKELGGMLIALAEPGPAIIEGGSDFELFGLRSHIDSQVRRAYTRPIQSVTLLGLRCSTIGYSNKGTASALDDTVVWDVAKGIHIDPTSSIKPRILVTFETLKRLRARAFTGRILYNEVEEITFRGYANYANVGKSFLSMREGDEVALRLRTLDVSPQIFDMLAVIGSIEQPLGDSSRDSSFITAARSLNYSPGRHRLQIPKWFSEIDQHTNKPIFSSVPAYELTYFVRFNDPIRR